jgi:hypothetical protein
MAGRSKTPVYERLHNRSKQSIKRESANTTPVSRPVTASPGRASGLLRGGSASRLGGIKSDNAGSRLYHKGVMMKKQTEATRAKMIEKQESEATSGFTFRPKINRNSSAMASSNRAKIKTTSTKPRAEDILIKKGRLA